MKTSRLMATIGLVLAITHSASADDITDRRLMRGDVTAAVGWLGVNKPDLRSYHRWRSEGLFEAGVGWYWTNHLKTCVEVAGTTDTDYYDSAPAFISGQQVFPGSHYKTSAFHVTASQAYQFGDNDWAHPYVSAGIDVVNEKTSREDDPVFIYDPVTRQSRLLRGPVRHPDHTDVQVRALISGGVKAYVSQKAFFLTSLRVTFGRDFENVLWRVGIGVDF